MLMIVDVTAAVYFYPRNGGLYEKARWFPDHWWASHVAWGFTTVLLRPLDCEDVSEHDLDVCITYIANGLEQDGTILSVVRQPSPSPTSFFAR